MTIAEAIKFFSDATTDKSVLSAARSMDDPKLLNIVTKTYEANEMALAALREKMERENPKPLTIEELDKMIGEPVYIFSHPLELWEWNVLAYKGAAYFGFKNGRKLSFGRYGEQWIAYRHKPKEVVE